ncbi:N-acetylmuramoyl-L-alanine amidase [Streptomyces sp. NBC_00046]|uniref:peptidoglycan recognition protein family protein n=1 Tax=Streptomyces sp. NBC_00046 TaxID=2975626 RepID=UPI0032546EB1
MAAPLTAERLLQALRAEGVRVVEVGNWRTRNRNHKGSWGPANGSLVHHTVTRGTDSTVRIVRDGYPDLPGPLCHGMIAKNGQVHLVGWGRTNYAGGGDPRVLDQVVAESYSSSPTPPTRGNANGVDGNAHFYGWECENLGDGRDPWPAAQYDAIVRVQAALCRAHGWSAKSVIGHREWSADKVDPRGIDMPLLRADVAERLRHPASWNPGTGPNEEDDMPDYVNLGLAKPYTLVPNAWDSIEFTQDGATPRPATRRAAVSSCAGLLVSPAVSACGSTACRSVTSSRSACRSSKATSTRPTTPSTRSSARPGVRSVSRR